MFRLEIIKRNSNGTLESELIYESDVKPLRHIINTLSPNCKSNNLNLEKLILKKKINNVYKIKEEHTKLKSNIYF